MVMQKKGVDNVLFGFDGREIHEITVALSPSIAKAWELCIATAKWDDWICRLIPVECAHPISDFDRPVNGTKNK